MFPPVSRILIMYNPKINPKLYCRPKNVRIGNEYLYVPDNVIATDSVEIGEPVTIIKKISVVQRGKALVKVKAKRGEFNVLLEHLAVNFI